VGSIVTHSIDENRVRIWVDTVEKIPKIGWFYWPKEIKAHATILFS
jgi:hypothetical protein